MFCECTVYIDLHPSINPPDLFLVTWNHVWRRTGNYSLHCFIGPHFRCLQTLDLTSKKKKKSKKPFDFGSENDNQNAGDSPKQETVDNDDLDLTDLSLKKKKKKKKPFNLDDLGDALPDNEANEENAGKGDDAQPSDTMVNDLDFDFTAKKKKKKKKTTFDLPDQEENDKENEGEALDDEGRDDAVSFGQSKWLESDRDYTYDELLELIYNKIKEKNPESETGTKKKLVMRPPQVLRVGTKKTSFANFLEICKSWVCVNIIFVFDYWIIIGQQIASST